MTDFKKFKEEESNLLGQILTLPKILNLEHFLYSHYSSVEISFHNYEVASRLDKTNLIYSLTTEEEQELNNGEFERLIIPKFNNSHNELREFFRKNVNHFDANIINTLARAIYFLKDYKKDLLYTKGEIISTNLNRVHFYSIIKKYTDELLSEIEWRINRIDPQNYYDYLPNNSDIKLFFDRIMTKGLILLNRDKFKKNSKEIYEKLVPYYFSEETTIEEFYKIFSSENTFFVKEIKWMRGQNALAYFLRELDEEQKLANNKHFTLAEKIFIDKDNKNYKNLSGNKSIPKNAIEIDKIVSLF